MHEDFSRSPEIKGSSDRSFGLIVAAFFALVAVLPVLHRPPSSVRWWALAVAVGFLTFALLRSRTLRPLNRAWQKLGLLLSRIAGPVVLALLFYAVVTPVGLLMRVSGNDPLRLRRRKPVSYWIAREPPGPAPETMKNQF